MNTSIYVSNARLTPSSYYRLTQYFRNTGVRMHSTLPDAVFTWWHTKGKHGNKVFTVLMYGFYVLRTLGFLLHDVLTIRHGTVIISKVIVPHRLPPTHKYLLKRLSKNNQLIWDFDDNLLDTKTISQADHKFMSQISNRIVVTNDYLKSLVPEKYAEKVYILPTTDGDMLTFDPVAMTTKRKALFDKEIRLVWVATATGLDYLSPIIPELDEAARLLKEGCGKQLTLHVVCNKPLFLPSSLLASHLKIVNILWERERAKQEIADAHIGLMPLPDTAFTRGKGAFKLIQYMSASMPVIASDVGYNKQAVTDGVGYLVSNDEKGMTWKNAIMALSFDWDIYLKCSGKAKEHYDASFSYNRNREFWEELLR